MINSEHLSLESLRRIEQVCAEFERDYLAHADIAAHLTGFSGVERAALIYELVGVDLELRAKAGLPLEARRYSEFDDPADREAGEQAYRRFLRSDTNSIAPSTLSGSQDSLGGLETLASRIGPYQILHKIGEGGMGSVYLAEQTEPVKRRVALKVISVHKPSREILTRFDAERQALALMDHHHIAKVLDAGVTPQGQPYFAMEFVDGEPLTRYCDKHQLPLPLRLALFIQTCRAVQHAHQKGVIHRDLKPANVLVTLHDGQPVAKVIDFGLAKALQDDGRLTDHSLLTRHGQLFGTLAYMSPEQAATNVLDVDARTDVYSLGAILYELLTGTTPLQPDRIRQEPLDRILAMIREEEPPRPSSRLKELGTDSSSRKQDSGLDPKGLARALERDLDWIALKALEKDRSRRYETPSALADDVQRYLDHDVVLARPPSGGYRLRKAIRKHRLLFGSGLAIVSLLILGFIGTGGMWWRASIAEAASRQEGERARQQAINAIAARAEMKNQRDQAVKSERKAVKSERKAVEAVARANYFLAVARWDAGRAKEANEFLDGIPTDLRRLEWRLAKRQFQGDGITLYGHRSAANSAAYSADGSRILSPGNDWVVRTWNAVTGEELLAIHGYWDAAYSSTGEQIFVVEPNGVIRILDAKTGREQSRLVGGDGEVVCLAVSPNGDQIATLTETSLQFWSLDTGKRVRSIELSLEGWPCDLKYSPDGGQVAACTDERTITLWDAESGKRVRTLSGHGMRLQGLDFDPSSNAIVSVGRESLLFGTLRCWDLATGEIRWEQRDERMLATAIATSPDGVYVAVAGEDGVVRLMLAKNGQPVRKFVGHYAEVRRVSFSSDGSRLVSASIDGTVKTWRLDDATPLEGIAYHFLRFSPDRRRWVEGSLDGQVHVRDVVTKRVVHKLTGHTGHVRCGAYSPDGRFLISGGHDKTVRVWDAQDYRQVSQYDGHQASVDSVAWDPKSNRAASADADGSIRLWSIDDPQNDVVLKGHQPGYVAVAFRPDGEVLISAGSDGVMKVWDATTHQLRRSWRGHASLQCMSLDPSGTLLATGGLDHVVKLWDVAKGVELRSMSGHSHWVNDLSFDSESARVISVSEDKTTIIWDCETGEELWKWQAGNVYPTRCLSIAPGDSLILVGSGAGEVHLLEAPVDQEVVVLRQHRQTVSDVGFSGDGSKIYSESKTEKIVWDRQTGLPLPGAQYLETLRFGNISPDSHWLAIPSGTDILLVDQQYKKRPEEAARRARIGQGLHWPEVQQANEDKDWFAETFRYLWIVKALPKSIRMRSRDSLLEHYRELNPTQQTALRGLLVETIGSDGIE